MKSTITLILFSLFLVFSMVFGISLNVALLVGFALFFGYGLLEGHGVSSLLRGAWSGIWEVRKVVMALLLIGMLTSSWRASGTIPAIVTDCLQLVQPSMFPLATFIMASLMSVLTGTCFGTAATMGAICMAIGHALNYSEIIIGGAILAGCYVGDRCSPLSAAAVLVSQVTKTELSHNLALMAKRAIVPVCASCILYWVIGIAFPPESFDGNIALPFSKYFDVGLIPLAPAAIVIALALFRVNARINMLTSTLAAVAVAIFVQHADTATLITQLLFGYAAPAEELAKTLNGGGLVSMLEPILIVVITSSYTGLFEKTGLLANLKRRVETLSALLGREAVVVFSSIFICGLCCNQTLGIMVGQQLYKCEYGEDNQSLALDIEDTIVVLCGAIPWSIACSVPLSAVGAPIASVFVAFYLFLQPLWMLVRSKMVQHTQK